MILGRAACRRLRPPRPVPGGDACRQRAAVPGGGGRAAARGERSLGCGHRRRRHARRVRRFADQLRARRRWRALVAGATTPTGPRASTACTPGSTGGGRRCSCWPGCRSSASCSPWSPAWLGSGSRSSRSGRSSAAPCACSPSSTSRSWCGDGAGRSVGAGPDAPMTGDGEAAEALAAITRQAAVLHAELQRAVAIFVHGAPATEATDVPSAPVDAAVLELTVDGWRHLVPTESTARRALGVLRVRTLRRHPALVSARARCRRPARARHRFADGTATDDGTDRAALARALQRVDLAAGTTLFAQGDPGDSLYVIVRGRLRLVITDDGRRRAASASSDPARPSASWPCSPVSPGTERWSPSATPSCTASARDEFERTARSHPDVTRTMLATLASTAQPTSAGRYARAAATRRRCLRRRERLRSRARRGVGPDHGPRGPHRAGHVGVGRRQPSAPARSTPIRHPRWASGCSSTSASSRRATATSSSSPTRSPRRGA